MFWKSLAKRGVYFGEAWQKEEHVLEKLGKKRSIFGKSLAERGVYFGESADRRMENIIKIQIVSNDSYF
jgi:hypothetical protein